MDFLKSVQLHWDTVADISDQSDRGAAIIAAAYLEDRLENIILQKLSATGLALGPKGDSVQKRLVGGNGPLATFSAKIDFAAAIGFLGPVSYRDAHLIRKIRNDFAHISTPATFEDEPMVCRCAELRLGQIHLSFGRTEPPTTAREQYLDTVFKLWNYLYTEVIHTEWKIEGPHCMP